MLITVCEQVFNTPRCDLCSSAQPPPACARPRPQWAGEWTVTLPASQKPGGPAGIALVAGPRPPPQALAGSSLSYPLLPSPMVPSLPWARHLPVLLLRMQPWAAWCQPESPWEPGVRPGPDWKAGALGSGRLGPELRRGSWQDRRPPFALLLLQAGVASACPPRSPLPDGFSLVLYLQLNGTLDNRPL